MKRPRISGLTIVIFTFLLIEFLDELVYGVHETAWPLIRSDLGLTYIQIGLAISVPGLVGNLIEPVFGILGDLGRRRVLILGGGIFFTLALLLISQAPTFLMLLLAGCLFNPSSGAFVSLSQATLMDAQPDRHEQNMARWTLAGSLGVVAGPLALSLAAVLGLGWRGLFAILAGFALLTLFTAWRLLPRGLLFGAQSTRDSTQDDETSADDVPPQSFSQGVRRALQALRRGEVLRWLVLLEFSDLMLDVLYGYLALYLVDVVGLSIQTAALGAAIWTGVGLLGDLLLIPLLERVDGITYLRVSVLLELVLFPAFLLVQPLVLKLAILGLLGFFNSGWYAILSGRLFSAMPGQSGTALTVKNITGWFGMLIPLGIGAAAQRFGLDSAMWLLLAGPLALLVGLPRGKPPAIPAQS